MKGRIFCVSCKYVCEICDPALTEERYICHGPMRHKNPDPVLGYRIGYEPCKIRNKNFDCIQYSPGPRLTGLGKGQRFNT